MFFWTGKRLNFAKISKSLFSVSGELVGAEPGVGKESHSLMASVSCMGQIMLQELLPLLQPKDFKIQPRESI